jgi:hypothetical protein
MTEESDTAIHARILPQKNFDLCTCFTLVRIASKKGVKLTLICNALSRTTPLEQKKSRDWALVAVIKLCAADAINQMGHYPRDNPNLRPPE